MFSTSVIENCPLMSWWGRQWEDSTRDSIKPGGRADVFLIEGDQVHRNQTCMVKYKHIAC